MIVPVFDFPKEAQAFVEMGLWQGKRSFGPCNAIGFANEDEGFVAAFVYHNYDPDAGVIEVSGYASRRNWANRELVRAIFEYPFKRVGVRMVVARHSEHNKRVRRIWRALGASEFVIPELEAEGEAQVISTLLRADWDQFEKRLTNGQEICSKASRS